MSPTIKELEISSGLIEAHSTIVLTNHNQQPVAVTVRTADMSSINDSLGFGKSSVSLAKYGLANWMSLPGGDQVIIPSGKTVDIPVSITNRSDLAPGGHYGAVVVSAGSANTASNTLGFKQELVSLVFVKKHGGEQYGLQLTRMKPDGGSQPDIVSLTFRDTGNVHVVPRGEVRLEDAKGTLLSKGIINPESTIVLPGGERQFVVIMKPVASSHALGRYKLTAYYHPEGVAQYDSRTMYLNHWPWWITASVGIMVVAAALVFWVLRHRRRN